VCICGWGGGSTPGTVRISWITLFNKIFHFSNKKELYRYGISGTNAHSLFSEIDIAEGKIMKPNGSTIRYLKSLPI
jgi:hypothetical protein